MFNLLQGKLDEFDLKLKTEKEFILRECQKQIAQSKLDILGEVVVKIEQHIKAYDVDPERAQKIADAFAAQTKLTNE
jgi:hypothetical protein